MIERIDNVYAGFQVTLRFERRGGDALDRLALRKRVIETLAPLIAQNIMSGTGCSFEPGLDEFVVVSWQAHLPWWAEGNAGWADTPSPFEPQPCIVRNVC